MGSLTNVLLLLFCINFMLYLGGYDSIASLGIFGVSETGEVNYSYFWYTVIGVAVIGLIAIVGTGTSLFVNQWAVFGVVVIGLIGLLATPMSFLSDPVMPIQIKIVVGGIIAILYSMAVLGFYRGYEP